MASTENADNSWLEQAPFYDYYLYSPLPDKCFRLFELFPGEGSGTVRGRLVHADLDQPPQYEAISYYWGVRKRRSIEVDGFKLHTTRSTVLALRQVRRRDESRWVWIDAVCINQEDLLERGHQVQLMGRIYSGADTVLVCLNSDGKCKAKGLLEDIHAAFEPVCRIPSYPWPIEEFFITEAQPDIRTRVFDEELHHLRRLLSNPWFSRVWVIQEVGLSRHTHLFCDDWDIPWNKVLFAVSFISAKDSMEKTKYARRSADLPLMAKRFWDPSSEVDFLIILSLVRGKKATDPRDKIFALLSHPSALNSDGLETLIQPDYQKSIQEIYYEVACSLMRGPGSLRVMCAVHHRDDPRKRSTSDMSWIPNWHTPPLSYQFGLHYFFHCAKPTSARFQIHAADKMLEMQGLLFDTITFKSNGMRRRNFRETRGSTNPALAIWTALSEPDNGLRRYPTFESFWEAYLQTLTADNIWWHGKGGGSPLVPMGDLEESWRQVRWSFEELGIERSIDKAKTNLDNPSAEDNAVLFFVEQAGMGCHYRRFFKSSRGFYGLGPGVTEEDDVICVPFGSYVPFVLRSDGTSGKWWLVGECYVHGIMYGEAIDMWKKGLIQEQTFHII